MRTLNMPYEESVLVSCHCAHIIVDNIYYLCLHKDSPFLPLKA